MRAYCTLFDRNYLYQGVALYDSLKRLTGDFKLYALCMDSIAFDMMKRMESKSLVPISVDELITPEVSAVRDRTTHGQFCWVCQPLVCEFVLDRHGHDMVTYLESDSLFFSDPEVLFQELGENAVSLVPHSFSPGFDNTAEAGRYCVQFNAFRDDKKGRAVLNYWKSSCFQYTREKPLVYPGQTSLNDWPERFDGVRALKHPGAGVAPWNIQHRKIGLINSVPHVDGVPVVFYHFHQYGRYEDGAHELGYYPLSTQVIDSLYGTYVKTLRAAEQKVRSLDREFNHRRTYKNNKSLGEILNSATRQDFRAYVQVLKRKIRGTYNVFPDEYFFKNLKREAGNA
jgi:hypothetical protein